MLLLKNFMAKIFVENGINSLSPNYVSLTLVSIGSGDGLSTVWHQAIGCLNAGLLLTYC